MSSNIGISPLLARTGSSRRAFLSILGIGAAMVADPERALWVPGRKLISIPKPYQMSELDRIIIQTTFAVRELGWDFVGVEIWPWPGYQFQAQIENQCRESMKYIYPMRSVKFMGYPWDQEGR
jgi:hypothetical protein